MTEWDQVAGDGDFGDNLTRGLALARRSATTEYIGLADTSRTFLDDVGGSSGPLLGLLFQALASAVDGTPLNPTERDRALIEGITEGLSAIQRVGEAAPGDRTMVDALYAAQQRGSDPHASLEVVALASLEGARSTAQMRARHGRASYVGDRVLGTPDPGAAGIAILLTSLAQHSSSGAPEATIELGEFLATAIDGRAS